MDSHAVVAVDGPDMKVVVVTNKHHKKVVAEGETLEQNLKSRTVLEMYSKGVDGEMACHDPLQHQNDVKPAHINCGIARIVFDAKGDALSEYSIEHSDSSSPTEQAGQDARDSDPMGNVKKTKAGEDFPRNAVEDEVNMESFREVLVNIIRETDLDITRLKNRKDMFQQLYVQYFGTGPDGSITDDGESHIPSLTRKLGSKFLRRMTNRVEKSSELFSHFDRLVENRKRRDTYQMKERLNSKRARYEDDGEWADTEASEPCGHIGRAGKVLNYPYITQVEEERILSSSNDSASAYAQNLAKVLFANTLDLYFKDQDPAKRQWLHEAVDFRFPSTDRTSQHLKWKSCSTAINKNMRLSERGPVEKSRQKEVDCIYVSSAFEEECYQKANKDPTKYAELMSLKLFEGSWDKFFKDQDAKMKDWLRQCVDRRFYLHDKGKRDARWKVCAAACNKNRTKIVGKDGLVEEYPYFPKETEEECFTASNGVPHLYAEAMAKLLFPDTPHLFFKDQDRGKRNWLHEMLDRRFPTPDKVHQISKWKSCTSAINRNMISIDAVLTSTVQEVTDVERKYAETLKTRVFDDKLVFAGEGANETQAALPDEKSSEEKEPEKEDDKEEKKKEENTLQDKEAKKKEEEASQKRSTSKNRPDKAVSVVKKNEKENTEEQPKRERESGRLTARTKPKRSDPYTSYPFVSEEEEIECFESSRKDIEAYARSLGRLLFKDSIKLLYKDQDESRRKWLKEILDFRFPTRTVAETKSKMGYAIAAINKNATSR